MFASPWRAAGLKPGGAGGQAMTQEVPISPRFFSTSPFDVRATAPGEPNGVMGQPHSVREALADQLGGAIKSEDLRGLAIDLSAARLRG